MTNVVIVVEGGRVTDVRCRNQNISIEVLDFDTQDPNERDQLDARLNQIRNSASYKSIYWWLCT